MTVNDHRLRRHPLGFLQVAILPSPEELKAYYSKLYYQTEKGNYRKAYSHDERAHINLKIAQKASLVAALRGSDPGSLLDVGCGEGFVLDWFSKAGWSVQGIDHSVAGLQLMNSHLLPRVEVGDLFALLLERIARGNRYELVWLSNVLEHVPDPVGLLTSLRRLVASNGILLVTVPNDGSAYQEELLRNGDIPDRFWIAIPDHLAYFSYESLTRIAEGTGWKSREIVADFPIDWFLLHPASNYVRERAKGPAAHQARIRMELLLGDRTHDTVNQFYSALARVGLGRNLTAFLSPESDQQSGREGMIAALETPTADDRAIAEYACMLRARLQQGSLSVEAVQPEHIEPIRKWRNAQMNVLRQTTSITLEQQEAYYQTHIWPDKRSLEPQNILLAYLENGQLIGYGGLVHISWRHRRAEVSFLLKPELADVHEAYSRYFATFLQLIKVLAFDDLNLKRVFTETYAGRQRHVATLEAAGFRPEGVLRHHAWIDGQPVDSVIHGCLKSDER